MPHDCPIRVQSPESGQAHPARIFNLSQKGLYFESDAFLEQGDAVHIGLGHPTFEELPGDYVSFRTTIMWRKELGEDACFYYGYGTSSVPHAAAQKARLRKERRKNKRRAPLAGGPALCRPYGLGRHRGRHQPGGGVRPVRPEASDRTDHHLENH
jgi:hypothetical protein